MSIISALTGISPKFVALGFEVSLAVAIAGAGFAYVHGLQSSLVEARADQAKTQAAFAEEHAAAQAAMKAVSDWQAAQSRTEATLQALADEQRQATLQTRKLNDALIRHDVPALAAKHPALVARALNSGTAALGRMLEQATASGGPDADAGR